MKNYDCIIIGAGVIGASVAHELAKYNLKVLVLEKENDVGTGASCANSAIVHSGYDPVPETLKAKLNVIGNKMYDDITKDLDVQFKRIGSITVALDEEEEKELVNLAKRSEENKVPYKILNQDELRKLEPNITKNAIAGLLAPTAGVINPFELVVALMENAMDNGVELHLEEEVIKITKDNGYNVTTSKDNYHTNYIVNASGVYSAHVNELVNEKSFTIRPRRGEYYVLDHFDDNFIKHTLFNVPTNKGKGVLVSPTTHENYLVGPSSDFIDCFDSVKTNKEVLDSVKTKATRLVDNIPYREQITEFAGLRSVGNTEDFIIYEKDHFINAAGIESPGLSAAPAIAKMISDFIPNKDKKNNYNPKRRPLIRLEEMSLEEKNKLIKKDPKFGRIVCRCEHISEGEILDAINRNCGAKSIKGVKRRCRPGMGKCQGGFCQAIVLKMLAKELGIEAKDVDYGNKGSYIVQNETKMGEKNE